MCRAGFAPCLVQADSRLTAEGCVIYGEQWSSCGWATGAGTAWYQDGAGSVLPQACGERNTC